MCVCGWGVVQHLPKKYEVLSPIPSTTKYAKYIELKYAISMLSLSQSMLFCGAGNNIKFCRRVSG